MEHDIEKNSGHKVHSNFKVIYFTFGMAFKKQNVCEYDQEIPHSQTADQLTAPRERFT